MKTAVAWALCATIAATLKREDGAAVIPADAVGAELVVRIHNQEGRVQWAVPRSLWAAG